MILPLSKALSLTGALFGAGLLAEGADLQSWKAAADKLQNDRSLLRHYVFDREADGIPNKAKGGAGTLLVQAKEPYSNPPGGKGETEFPRWTEGRFPGKPALQFRSAKDSVMCSQFYNTGTDGLSIEIWLRTCSETGEKGQAIVASVGSGFGSGWTLSTSFYNSGFRLGRPKESGGDVDLSVKGSLRSHVWNHLVAEAGNGVARLYVNGELAAEKRFEGSFKQPPTPGGSFLQTPEEDRGGLKIGSVRTPFNTLFFDCDELAVYGKALSGEEVKARYEAGRPDAPPEEQIAAHKALLARQDLEAAIEAKLPLEPYGYFPRGTKQPLSISVPEERCASLKLPLRAEAALRGMDGAEGARFECEVKRVEGSGARGAAEIAIPQRCGLYFLDIAVKDAAGQNLKRCSLPLASNVPVAPMAERPESSPLGAHGGINIWPEAAALGMRHERDISPWRPKLKDGSYDWNSPDHYMSRAESIGWDMLFCEQAASYEKAALDKVLNGDASDWEAWLLPLVERYKGHVAYWEVCNEPNARGCSPEQYLALLKVAHKIIRERDPGSKIVGFCGVSEYPEWTEKLLALGGGAYLDAVSFHNYIGGSPIAEWRRLRKIERVKGSMQRHLGKILPIWNSESGIHQSWRVEGKPLNDDELLALYPRGRKGGDGITLVPADAITMATEHVGACWQMQSILLDCSLGVERFYTLMGASRYYPSYNGPSSGYPSEKGLAFAALASVMGERASVEQIPVSSFNAAGVLVKSLKGKRTAAFFAERPVTLCFEAPDGRIYQGMDFVGNPLTFKAQGKALSLTLGMEPVYLFDVEESFKETKTLSFDEFPSTVSPLTRAEGSLTLFNPLPSKLDGILEISSENSSVSFDSKVELSPGESRKIAFTLNAGPLKRGKQSVSARLLKGGAKEFCRSEIEFSSEGVARAVPRVERQIKLDADASDWEGIGQETADKAENVVIGKPPVGYIDPNCWRGAKDLSFSVKTAWRKDDGLYFLLSVADDAIKTVPPEQAGRSFLQDALELFFDGRDLKGQTASYGFGAEQILVVPSVESEAKPCVFKSCAKYGESLDLEFAGRRTSDGYIIEGRLRPKEGAPFKLEAGQRFGMDFAVDDAADAEMSRRTQMALHGTARNSLDTSEFGRYRLAEEATASARTLLDSAKDGAKMRFNKSSLEKAKASEAEKVKAESAEEDGKKLFKIESSSREPVHVWWEGFAPVGESKPVQISFQAKMKLEGKARYALAEGLIVFLGDKGAWLGCERIGSQNSNSAAEWGSFEKSMLTPAGTKSVGFRGDAMCSEVDGKAEMLFRDITIKEL